jgi:hypothetical protein
MSLSVNQSAPLDKGQLVQDTNWYHLSPEEAANRLQVDPAKLNAVEAGSDCEIRPQPAARRRNQASAFLHMISCRSSNSAVISLVALENWASLLLRPDDFNAVLGLRQNQGRRKPLLFGSEHRPWPRWPAIDRCKELVLGTVD